MLLSTNTNGSFNKLSLPYRYVVAAVGDAVKGIEFEERVAVRLPSSTNLNGNEGRNAHVDA